MATRRDFLSTTMAAGLGVALAPFKALALDNFVESNAFNVLLGRPTNNSITANLLCKQEGQFFLAYGAKRNALNAKTTVVALNKGDVQEFVLDGLQANAANYYKVCYQSKLNAAIISSEVYQFQTARKKGQPFVFTITADSHLGTQKHCDPQLYQQTLNNVAKDNPDIHFALGDEFRASKVKDPNYTKVEALYHAQREHLGTLCHQVPYFFILGNHEMEAKAFSDGTENCLASWSEKARKKLVPNPIPNQFYSGNEQENKRQNYYAFEWGDVLFVTLDVFWYSNISSEDEEMREKDKALMENLSKEERMKLRAEREKAKENKQGHPEKKKDQWSFTLGDEQYKWLQQTLAKSTSKYKFVLGHHVMGSCRGAVEWATTFEWGGKNRKGVAEFKTHRPNWELPIHDLFVKYKVTAFIQGHDHLFARQTLDGVAYITCPMCGDPGYNTYNADGYLSGDKLSNTGHLRIAVADKEVRMDYIKAVLPKDEAQQGANGKLAYAWSFTQQKNLVNAS